MTIIGIKVFIIHILSSTMGCGRTVGRTHRKTPPEHQVRMLTGQWVGGVLSPGGGFHVARTQCTYVRTQWLPAAFAGTILNAEL